MYATLSIIEVEGLLHTRSLSDSGLRGWPSGELANYSWVKGWVCNYCKALADQPCYQGYGGWGEGRWVVGPAVVKAGLLQIQSEHKEGWVETEWQQGNVVIMFSTRG